MREEAHGIEITQDSLWLCQKVGREGEKEGRMKEGKEERKNGRGRKGMEGGKEGRNICNRNSTY